MGVISVLISPILNVFYMLAQWIIIFLFKPEPPASPKDPKKPRGRIAVIGAGLTGISSAAHCIAHGFDVVIYEKNSKIGGIWANVNSTSGLQINSVIYRFHPAVLWKRAFPQKDEILGQITKIWKEYQLEPRTRFDVEVTKITRTEDSGDPQKDGYGRWKIHTSKHEGPDGTFDAVIVTVGTCGTPRRPKMEGTEEYEQNGGRIVHSSELDHLTESNENNKASSDTKPKSEQRVVVIGSGASGVEAVEWAVQQGYKRPTIIAREDKWIIPRNIVFDTALSAQPFGREMPLSFIWEWIITTFHYGRLHDLTPTDRGIFEGTPIVNDDFLDHVRSKKAAYVRGDVKKLTSSGVLLNVRSKKSKPGDSGEEREMKADMIILATGFEHPNVKFLPDDLFPEGYERPNLYLQNFSTEDWSVLLTNSAYLNAIGTVGHFHIGIYTRILLTFLMDENTRPLPKDMKLWVDFLRYFKRGAKGGALSFFTYMELTIWLVGFHVFRVDRLKWIFFIMQGWGVSWRR